MLNNMFLVWTSCVDVFLAVWIMVKQNIPTNRDYALALSNTRLSIFSSAESSALLPQNTNAEIWG